MSDKLYVAFSCKPEPDEHLTSDKLYKFKVTELELLKINDDLGREQYIKLDKFNIGGWHIFVKTGVYGRRTSSNE